MLSQNNFEGFYKIRQFNNNWVKIKIVVSVVFVHQDFPYYCTGLVGQQANIRSQFFFKFMLNTVSFLLTHWAGLYADMYIYCGKTENVYQ